MSSKETKIYRVGANGSDELVEAPDGRDALLAYADTHRLQVDWVTHDVYENEMAREEHQIKARGNKRSWTIYAVEEHVIRSSECA